MARLDGTIERLLKQAGGLELQLETGSGINLKTKDAVVPVLRQPLTTQQLVGALGEILPPENRTGFPQAGASQFGYQSPFGSVTVKMDYAGGKLRATIVPGAAPAPVSAAPAPAYAATPAPAYAAAPTPAAAAARGGIELPPEEE